MAMMPDSSEAGQEFAEQSSSVQPIESSSASSSAAPLPEAVIEASKLMQQAINATVEADPTLERATVTLPKDALEFLRMQAGKRGISTGEMVRTAIGTQKFLMEKIAAGQKLQLRDSTGRIFDVTI